MVPRQDPPLQRSHFRQPPLHQREGVFPTENYCTLCYQQVGACQSTCRRQATYKDALAIWECMAMCPNCEEACK